MLLETKLTDVLSDCILDSYCMSLWIISQIVRNRDKSIPFDSLNQIRLNFLLFIFVLANTVLFDFLLFHKWNHSTFQTMSLSFSQVSSRVVTALNCILQWFNSVHILLASWHEHVKYSIKFGAGEKKIETKKGMKIILRTVQVPLVYGKIAYIYRKMDNYNKEMDIKN